MKICLHNEIFVRLSTCNKAIHFNLNKIDSLNYSKRYVLYVLCIAEIVQKSNKIENWTESELAELKIRKE